MLIADTKRKAVEAFPVAAVETCLREELTAALAWHAEMHGQQGPTDVGAQAKRSTHIDSLLVVEILCTVESVLKMELCQDLVCAGGYGSVNEAVDHLVPRIGKAWQKRTGGRP